MRQNLFPTTVYLNDEQRKQLQLLSRTLNTPKAEVTRLVITKGIEAVQKERGGSAQAVLALAGLIPPGSGLPSDLSERHNAYTWDE
ncbi:MAG: hypothetical protein U0074_13235 [Kouleothrix sp.]